MARYVLERVLWVIPLVLAISLIVFGIMKAIPGDAAQTMVGENGTAQDVAAMRRALGLDRPVYVQYALFLEHAARLDFGRSAVSQQPVSQDIAADAGPTIQLALAAMALAVAVGLAAGVVSATYRYTIWDHLVTVITLVGVSMPIFWLGLMLMMLFSVDLGWLPSGGSGSLAQLVLPAVTLASSAIAAIARQTRSSMLEALGQDYVRTARAKGLPERAVVVGHALRNALIPVVTVIGLQTGALLGGAVVTETVFARPGLGRLLIDSIRARDVAVVQPTIMLLAITFVVVNLLVDLLYVKIDPRIRYG